MKHNERFATTTRLALARDAPTASGEVRRRELPVASQDDKLQKRKEEIIVTHEKLEGEVTLHVITAIWCHAGTCTFDSVVEVVSPETVLCRNPKGAPVSPTNTVGTDFGVRLEVRLTGAYPRLPHAEREISHSLDLKNDLVSSNSGLVGGDSFPSSIPKDKYKEVREGLEKGSISYEYSLTGPGPYLGVCPD